MRPPDPQRVRQTIYQGATGSLLISVKDESPSMCLTFVSQNRASKVICDSRVDFSSTELHTKETIGNR